MPPRYAYWTILVDEQPTAFRAALQEELQPTFKRLKEKQPSARMVWFQNGKVWNSRLDAQEAMRARGERGRAGDFRQQQRQRREGTLEWKPRGESRPKLEWQPRGTAPAQDPRPRTHGPRPKTHDPRPRTHDPRPRTHDPKPTTRRGKDWRPGGEHRDPRQKYKDAKKAKWTRVKKTIRARWEKKQGRKKDEE